MRRYFLTYDPGTGDITQEVFPVEQNVKIEGERIEHMIGLRRVFKGTLYFSGTTYDLVKGQDECTSYKVEVWDFCTTAYRKIFTGMFTTHDCEWDYDRGSFVTGLSPLDAITPLMKVWKKEVNILQGVFRNSVHSQYAKNQIESYRNTPWYYGLPIPPVFTIDPNKYVLTEVSYFEYAPNQWQKEETWQREVYYDRTFGSDPPSGGGWVLEGTTADGDKYIRPWLNLSSGTFNMVTLGDEIYYTLLEIDSATQQYSNALKVMDVLTKLIEGTGLNSVVSNFFNDAYNYVLGSGFGENPLRYMMMMHLSDTKGYSNPAWKGMISLETLMHILVNTLNVRWFINSSNQLQIEHVSWQTYQVGLDLRASVYRDYVQNTRRWKYDGEIPNQESWSWLGAKDRNFIGMPIEYDCFSHERETAIVERDLSNLITDVYYIQKEKAKIPDEGWVLLQVGLNIDGEYAVGYEQGEITGVVKINGHFSQANLHVHYWRHGRYLRSGKMNGVSTLFSSKVRNRIGEKITIPLPGMNFDEGKIIRTPLGFGEVISFSYEVKTGYITIELAYE